MPVVNGTNGNDFIHRAGDGRSVPVGYTGVTGVTTGNDTIYGFGGNDIIFGDLGNDIINGGTGADTMDGGAGNDWYYVDAATDRIIEGSGNGSDRILSYVNYVLGAGVAVELLTSTNAVGTGALNLTGNELAQTIAGNAGANILNGRGGIDTLIGYGGNDTYYVDHVADIVTEVAGAGSDRVLASVSYVLGAGAHVEILTTTLTAGTIALNLTGNSFVQTMHGNAGANILNGGGGADTLIGFGGNDIYFVDTAGDQVTEGASGGSDRILASVSYALAAAAQIEIFTTTNTAGTGAINLTGNDFAQHMLGNAGNNILNGQGGNDILDAGNGDDTLNGGSGDDTMWGGANNDVYYVDSLSDVVNEAPSSGVDTIRALVTNVTLAANVENGILSMAGGGALYGNALSNHLTGGAGNDTLDGGAGDDTMVGGAGDDHYAVYSISDVITENAGEGTDSVEVWVSGYTLAGNVESATIMPTDGATLNGNFGDNSLTGGTGDDTLNGSFGNDVLNGGAGNDTLAGGYGNDDLNGGSGNDYLSGFGGNDTYHIENGDIVDEAGGDGIDTIILEAGYSLGDTGYTLASDIENLTIMTALNDGAYFVGNDLANVITGSEVNDNVAGFGGNDSLSGNGGDDELFGYTGDDTLNGGSGNDIIHGDEGADTIIGGSGNDNLKGQVGDDTINGGDGIDAIYGDAGADVLTGGTGADTFIYLAVSDSPVGASYDAISDFECGTDIINLFSIDANVNVAFNQAFTYVGSASTGNAGDLWINKIGGPTSFNNYMIYGDTNGDGLADFQIQVHLAVAGEIGIVY